MSDQQIFTNNQIDVGALPTIESVQYEPLQPSYRTFMLISGALATLILVIATFVATAVLEAPQWVLYTGPGFWIFTGLIQVIFIVKGFRYKGYALREHDLVYKKGWLYKQHITVPFSRIQHVDIKEGVLERLFNISRLNVYTAGGQSSDLTIPGLLPEDSRRLRSFIVQIMTTDEEE